MKWKHRIPKRFRLDGRLATMPRSKRVGWTINGQDLWLESDDVDLVQSNEALACLAVTMAGQNRVKVAFDQACSGLLQKNLSQIAKVWAGWWPQRCKPDYFDSSRAGAAKPLVSDAPARTAMFFSLGADSFHTFLNHPEVDTLVYVWGFDVRLRDPSRFKKVEKAVRKLADETGKQVIVVRTNMREHPLLRRGAQWMNWFGPALAAVGHCLPEAYRRILISSSYSEAAAVPCGSLWWIDPLWSSETRRFEHFGERFERLDKIEAIAGNELVQKHLRVCWQSSNEEVNNCGRCEKCVRTLLAISLFDDTSAYTSFPQDVRLADTIGEMKPLPKHLLVFYEQMLEAGLSDELSHAVRGWLDRSQTLVR